MIIYLQFSSLVGVSIGATHFYGSLRCLEPWKRVDLTHELTASEGRELTKRHGKGYTYKAGFVTESFETKDAIRELAISTYREHFPGAVKLVEGNPALPAEECKLLHEVK